MVQIKDRVAMKKKKDFDPAACIQVAENVSKLAADCGYTWHRGQHPDEQISVLLTAFTELGILKKALPAPKREL